VTLDKNTFYSDRDGDGIRTCEPLLAGRYLCEAIGKRTTSSAGYSLVFDNLNNRIHPSAGQRLVFSQDVAGLGGSVRYIRTRLEGDKYRDIGHGFIANAHLEGGYIKGLGQDVRLTDRFFLGEPQIRGFDIRGVGPRVVRTFTSTGSTTSSNNTTDDALGGRAYYLGHLELELPLGSGARELGLRPSVFVDAGAVFGVKNPQVQDNPSTAVFPTLNRAGEAQCLQSDNTISTIPNSANPVCSTGTLIATTVPPFTEAFRGNSAKPRVSVGIGVNWNSPFGPFRIDVAKALVKVPGDQTKLFTFNVGTQF
jgi:outer membrane protein insertion porin family